MTKLVKLDKLVKLCKTRQNSSKMTSCRKESGLSTDTKLPPSSGWKCQTCQQTLTGHLCPQALSRKVPMISPLRRVSLQPRARAEKSRRFPRLTGVSIPGKTGQKSPVVFPRCQFVGRLGRKVPLFFPVVNSWEDCPGKSRRFPRCQFLGSLPRN